MEQRSLLQSLDWMMDQPSVKGKVQLSSQGLYLEGDGE